MVGIIEENGFLEMGEQKMPDWVVFNTALLVVAVTEPADSGSVTIPNPYRR